MTLNLGTTSGRAQATFTAGTSANIYLGALTGGVGSQVTGADKDNTLSVWNIGGLNNATVFDGRIRNNTALRVCALTKVGAGTLTLRANSDYTGFTTIGNGVLALSGSGALSGTTNITVTGGGIFDVSATTAVWSPGAAQTLAGVGVVTGDVAAVSGTLSPGAGVGTLSFANNLTLTEGVACNFDLTSPGVNDTIVVAGDLTLNSLGTGVLIRVSPTGAVIADGSYRLFKWGGTLPAGDTNSLLLQYPAQTGTFLLDQNLVTKEILLRVTGTAGAANLTWRASRWRTMGPGSSAS